MHLSLQPSTLHKGKRVIPRCAPARDPLVPVTSVTAPLHSTIPDPKSPSGGRPLSSPSDSRNSTLSPRSPDCSPRSPYSDTSSVTLQCLSTMFHPRTLPLLQMLSPCLLRLSPTGLSLAGSHWSSSPASLSDPTTGGMRPLQLASTWLPRPPGPKSEDLRGLGVTGPLCMPSTKRGTQHAIINVT